MARGFLYLVAIMDWHSRYVVAWGLSNILNTGFCAEALGEALNQGTPEVFNTDQGSQFTSREFTQILRDHSVKISMDGRGRYQDNILGSVDICICNRCAGPFHVIPSAGKHEWP